MSEIDPIVANVEKIARDPLAGGAERAYQALQQNYQQYADEHNCASQQELNQYWTGVTSELQRKGLMPDLAVAWANAEFHNLDTESRKRNDLPGSDGMLDRSELRKVQGKDSVFANVFMEQEGKRDFFHEVARKTDNGNTRKVIEQTDIDRYLNLSDKRTEKGRKQENAREAMAPLFEETENGQTLMASLDLNKNGRVSHREERLFMEQYRATPGEGVYTEKNAEYVKSIMEGRQSEFEKARLGGSGFGVNKLARKGGFDATSVNSSNDYDNIADNMHVAGKHGDDEFANEIKEAPLCPEPKVEVIEPTSPEKSGVNDYTVTKGQGYWHVVKEAMNDAGIKATNNEVFAVMTALMTEQHAQFSKQHPGYKPTLHPGDVVHCDLDELAAKNPAVKKILRK